MISKDGKFPPYNYNSIQDFCTARFFHLDNPDPNPVGRKTKSNPNFRQVWTPKSGSFTPLQKNPGEASEQWPSQNETG